MSVGWRVAVLGGVFLALFTVLTLRMWQIQVTASEDYVEQAAVQQLDIVETPAPRGEIVDRNGVLLAGTRTTMALVVNRKLISKEEEPNLIQKLAAFAGIPAPEINDAFEQAGSGQRFTLVEEITDGQALFLVEHREDFPGVLVEPVPIRIYPQGELAAHVVGYIGQPTDDDLRKIGVRAVDKIGRAGIEKTYDDLLRGEAGIVKYQVDAKRNILGVRGEQPPSPGGTVVLTLDTGIQQALESALTDGLDLARAQSRSGRACVPQPTDPTCPVRAVGVVIDPGDGSVLAMASVPGYDPSIFVDGFSQLEWETLQSGAVLNNFAIQGVFPPASTFKTVAYVTALEDGAFPRDDISSTGAETDTYLSSGEQAYFCDGRLEFDNTEGSPFLFNDWLAEGHGNVDIHEGLQSSCDLYFWEIALRIWRGRNDAFQEDLLQEWARRFGFEAPTGIDLPFERSGLLGDRDWFEEQQQNNTGRVRAEGPWSGGDLLNLVIGQGTVVVTPLQLANAYAAMVNGGTLWTPYVVDRVVGLNADDVLWENNARSIREVEMAPTTIDAIRSDLRLVVNGPVGTARTAFADFGPGKDQVGGKTGTAEVIKSGPDAVNTAWFVGAVPIDNPSYVVVVVVDRGGSGGRIAAPIGRQVLQYLVNGPEGVSPVNPGAEAD